MNITVRKEALEYLVRNYLLQSRINPTVEAVEGVILTLTPGLEKEEPQIFHQNKFTVSNDSYTLKPSLPLGTDFFVAVDCEGDIILYDGNLFTEAQYDALAPSGLLILPKTAYDIEKDDLFIKIPASCQNIVQFWDTIESSIS